MTLLCNGCNVEAPFCKPVAMCLAIQLQRANANEFGLLQCVAMSLQRQLQRSGWAPYKGALAIAGMGA